jgi:CheY-like chemotaxis protein
MQSLQGFAILVVDDDAETLALYAQTFERLGATVQAASSAERALSILEAWRPDVMLCDLHLPGVDGYTLLARIREREPLQALPVIAISGSDPTLEGERCRRAGFHEHLTKPVKLEAIVSAIHEAKRRSAPD